MQFPDERMPTLPIVTPYSLESIGNYMSHASIVTGSLAGTGVANLALFFPLTIQKAVKFVKGFAYNGAAVAGNLDVGLYDRFFNLLVSMGSTAQAGTNAIQEFDITDTTLMPGKYWMAISSSSISGNLRGSAASDEIILPVAQILGQTSSFPLPSTATPTQVASNTPLVPLFGFTQDTTI